MSKEWNPYHLNALAKEIRELFPTRYSADRWDDDMVQRGTLAALALAMARRIKEDNPTFDHLKWLDQCSADKHSFPFSELWKDKDD